MEKKEDLNKKYNEYKMKIVKIAGHLSDFYIDQAIDTEDYSFISGALIDYFLNKEDVGYLLSRFKEFELDKKIEDIDFNVLDWYRLKEEYLKPSKDVAPTANDVNSYIHNLVEKRQTEEW